MWVRLWPEPLCAIFKTLDGVREADMEELQKVNDVGEVSAQCIRAFFDDGDNQKLYESLKASGVNMDCLEVQGRTAVLQDLPL